MIITNVNKLTEAARELSFVGSKKKALSVISRNNKIKNTNILTLISSGDVFIFKFWFSNFYI